MGITPIERLKLWFAQREANFEPPTTVTGCSECPATVQPGTGYWDGARRAAQCSEECRDEHVSSWA